MPSRLVLIGAGVCVRVCWWIYGKVRHSRERMEQGRGRDADGEETLNPQEITTEEIELKTAKYRPQDLFHYRPFPRLLSLSHHFLPSSIFVPWTPLSKKINENKTRPTQGADEKRKHTISGYDKGDNQRFNHIVRNILTLRISWATLKRSESLWRPNSFNIEVLLVILN